MTSLDDHGNRATRSPTFVLLNAAMLTAFFCAVVAIDSRFAWFGGDVFAPVNFGIGLSRILTGPTAAVMALAILVGALLVGRRRARKQPGVSRDTRSHVA